MVVYANYESSLLFGHQINKEQLKDPFFAAIK